MIRAYDEIYLNDAKNSLSMMLDYLINDCGMDSDLTGDVFVRSGYVRAFEDGNPAVLAGMSGIDLARRIIRETFPGRVLPERCLRFERSPEYWAGWALAEYQWHSCRRFEDILERVSLSEIIQMYGPYHEMDIAHFLEAMNERCSLSFEETRLGKRRKYCGLSQRELSIESGVGIRSIQLYEQRVNDIDRAQVHALYRLALTLRCSIEDLLEDPLEV